MEKTILQNGTRVISYAPDDECDNELGTITSSYEYNGKVYYDIHLDNHEEGCEDLDMNEEGIHFDVIPVEFINLTPHDIKLNDGTVYPATGKIARVTFSNFCCGISRVFYGEVENLPEPKRGTMYIVSAMVLAAAKEKGRTDLIAPATGHPDCIRSVPGFVR